MELLAVIVGLETLNKDKSLVEVFSDSKYVVDAVEKNGFLVGKKKNLKVKKIRILWKRFFNCL